MLPKFAGGHFGGAAMLQRSPRSSLSHRRWPSLSAVCLLTLMTPLCALSGDREPGASTAGFSVHVTDLQSESPIDQVRIDLVRLPGEIVDTRFSDSKGDADFSDVPPDAYVLRTFKDGYAGVEVQVDFRGGERNMGQIPLQLRPAGDVAQPRPEGDTISARTLAIPQGARHEFETGITCLNRKRDPKGSLKHFQKAIAAYPDYYEAYFLAGMADLQIHQPDDARAALAQALKLNPKFIEPYYPLATLLMSEKSYAEANSLLARAQQLDPSGWQWPFELARSNAYQEQWDQALANGEKALHAANPPAKVHLLMADLYEDTGSPTKAIDELEEFEKLEPASPYIPRVQSVLAQLQAAGKAAQ
jgi:cytochrome c-type biogenesis protein CcmH/NrfG